MDIRTQAALLAAIVTLALAVAALLRDNRSRVFTLFALFSADLFLFSLSLFLLRWPQAFGSIWWDRLAVASGALVPAAALAFFLEFLGVARRPARRARNAMLAGSLTGIVVAATPLVHVKAAKLVVAAYVVGGLATVLSVLWGKMVSSQTRVERARLLYLFIGALVAVGCSRPSTCCPASGCPTRSRGSGSIALTVFMFFLSQTLQRHRLLDLHEFLGKIVVVTALGLVLVVIYGGLVSWVGDRRELFYFNTVVASFVILSLFDPLRERVEEWVVATLFRERYELVRRLEKLRDRTGNVIDPAGLAAVVLDGLVETRRVTHCSLWLLADDRPGYRLLDFRGPPPAPFLEPATARALLAASSSGQKAILLENIDRRVAELRALLPPGPAGHESRSGRGAPAAIAEELKRLSDARGVMAAMKAGICDAPPRRGPRGRLPRLLGRAGHRGVRLRRDRGACSRSATAAPSSSRTPSSTSR